MIPQRNISMISNTLMTAGGHRIPEAVIERDYVLAWLLTGLAGDPLREVPAFKGGTALRRCWFEDYRFSEDLDLTKSLPASNPTQACGSHLIAQTATTTRTVTPSTYATRGRCLPKTT